MDPEGGLSGETLRHLKVGSRFCFRRFKQELEPIFPPTCHRAMYIGSGENVALLVQAAYEHLSQSQQSRYSIQHPEKVKTIDIAWGVSRERECWTESSFTDPSYIKSQAELRQMSVPSESTYWMADSETRAIYQELVALCNAFPARVRLVFFRYGDIAELENSLNRLPSWLDGTGLDIAEQDSVTPGDGQRPDNLRRVQVQTHISGPEPFRSVAWEVRTGSSLPVTDQR